MGYSVVTRILSSYQLMDRRDKYLAYRFIAALPTPQLSDTQRRKVEGFVSGCLATVAVLWMNWEHDGLWVGIKMLGEAENVT